MLQPFSIAINALIDDFLFFRVLYNIMANEYVSDGYKDRLRVAARSGRDDGVCHVSLFL